MIADEVWAGLNTGPPTSRPGSAPATRSSSSGRSPYGTPVAGDSRQVLARDAVCLLDVPVHKTGTAFTKPVDPLQCPHHMACAKCHFYAPKDSTKGQLLEASGNLQQMLAAVPLTDDERAAVDDGRAALYKLLDRLADVPTLPGPPLARSARRQQRPCCPSPPSHTAADARTDRSILVANHEWQETAWRSSAAASGPLLTGEGDGQDVEAGDAVKVPEIGCSDTPSGSYCGRRD